MDKLLHTSLGAQTQLTDGYFNGPSDSEQEIDNSTLVDENGLGIWSGDQPARSVRYNYATEKSMSHVDAKLFYQQHRLEASRQDTEPSIPMAQPETSPLNSSENLEGLSRGASTSSRRSLSRNVPKESTMPMRPLGSDKLTSNRDPSSAVLSRSDAHTALSRAEAKIDDINSSNHPMEHQSSGADTEFGAQGMNSSNIAPEMRAICTSIKEVLSIRRNYIKLSLQTSHDNPKDQDGWKIYPPPPEPVWDDIKNRPRNQTSGTSSLVNSTVLSSDQYPTSSPVIGGITHEVPLTPTTKTRKPGVNVGEDFELSDLLPLPKESGDTTFKLDKHGVFQVYEGSKSVEINSPNFFVPTLRDFYKDLEYVKNVSSDGPSKSFAYRELDILEGKFNLYFLMKEYEETATCKRVPHRDFYNVRKVDTHVHHSSCMNQKHLLRFIKSKMKKSPDEIVLFRDGKHLTLTEVFESINLTAYDLSIDTLDMHVRNQYLR